MKYLKRFETYERYLLADYVMGKTKFSKNEIFCKIIETEPYLVETIYGKTYLESQDILRELTPDEIEDFKIQLTSNKYNL